MLRMCLVHIKCSRRAATLPGTAGEMEYLGLGPKTPKTPKPGPGRWDLGDSLCLRTCKMRGLFSQMTPRPSSCYKMLPCFRVIFIFLFLTASLY